MAWIEEGSTWFESFADNNGAAQGSYFTYSADLDTTLGTARNALNTLWDRIGAVGGPSALAALKLLALNDENGPQAWPPDCTDVETTDGFIGAHSYVVTVGSVHDYEADITKGQMIMGGSYVELASPMTLASPGGTAQDHYFSVDTYGVVSVATTSGARDFATLAWDGSKYTGTMTRQVPVFMDGDAWRQLQERPSGLAFPAVLYEEPDERILALERFFSGYDTDGLGNAIGPLALPFGAVGDPQVCFGSAGAADDAGWFRSALDEWAFTDGTSRVLRIADDGLHVDVDGSAATCALSVGGNEGVGFYEDTSDVLACAGAGVRSCRFTDGQTWIEDGTALAPGLAFGSDANTGIWTDTADFFKVSTGGGYCLGLDPTGNLDLPLNSRVSTSGSGYAMSAGAYDSVDMDTEQWDVGGWHSGTSASHTVPTGADGIYDIKGAVAFLESTIGGGGTPNSGNKRGVAISIGGTPQGIPEEISPIASGDTKIGTSITLALTAGQVITVDGIHDNTTGDSTMNVDATLQIKKSA